MTALKIVFLIFLLSVEVFCWTLDLNEMHKLDSEMTTERNEGIGEEERMRNELEDDYQTTNDAEDLEYQSYMEKRIHNVLNNGSIYLDGLRKAMAHYRETLDNCTTMTTTAAPTTWLSEDAPYTRTVADVCKDVMDASDQVTKLSELALWATNELRERKFARNNDTAQDEEEQLLLKLAWFLDQLAHLTGYNPELDDYQTTTDSSTDSTTNADEFTTSLPETSHLEIMQSVENGPSIKLLPKQVTAVKNVKKRSLDATNNFVQNYIKYKVWHNDNDMPSDNKNDPFDVNNDLKVKPIKKRSVSLKKAIFVRPVKSLTKIKSKLFKSLRDSRLLKKYSEKKKVVKKIIS